MSLTQNEKIRQVTEATMVIGVDIASEMQRNTLGESVRLARYGTREGHQL